MKPRLLFNYDYDMTPYSHRQPWSPAFQLQEALREYFDRSDVVFFNTPSFADEYPKDKRVLLMEAVDTWGYYRQPADLDFDLGFLGSEAMGYRINLLNMLSNRYNMLRGQMEMGPTSSRELSRCKLVLSIQDYWEKNAYIERRTYTFGNVRPLLIHMNDDYLAVGAPHIDYIPYTDEASLISQIDHYLAHYKEREQIGNNMILNLKENHTNQIRAKTVYQAFCAL